MEGILGTKSGKIVAVSGRDLVLQGVNLGGWLMMEGYILHSPNCAVKLFKKHFAQVLGQKALQSFEKNFQDQFIREEDFKRIAHLGFNCVRLPFHHGLIERRPFHYSREGTARLDKALHWAQKYKIWIILDLHGACGSQNHDWHSDSSGKADLWVDKNYQKRTFALWEFLADRYRNNPWIAGYDLLNEAVVDDPKVLNRFYKQLIKTIRSVDKSHILFIEGNRWAQDLECLDEFEDDNYVLSVHSYEPIDLTFNFVPHLRYPLNVRGRKILFSNCARAGSWNRGTVRNHLERYQKISRRRSVPVYVGEFGVNYREGLYGEDQWVEDMLAAFREFGFHWTYWTYKAVKNHVFPDGVFSYMGNPPWVNRAGPRLGWDTYHLHWPTRKEEITDSWRTENFKENIKVSRILRKYALKNHQSS